MGELRSVKDLPFSKKNLKLANQKPTKKELDDLCREVVFLRDHNRCRKCGKTTGKLDWAHFLTRGNLAVRWDLDNSFILCSADHTMKNDSAHKDPAGFVVWVKEQLGEERYNALRLRAAAVKQVDRWGVKLYLLAEKKKLERKD